MTEIQSDNLLDRLVGLSETAKNTSERQSVVNELLEHSNKQWDALGPNETKITLSEEDQTKVVAIGTNVIQGHLQDVLDNNSSYNSTNDLFEETLNATAGFRLSPKVLAGLDQKKVHAVIKSNFPDSWDLFDTMNACISTEAIVMQGAAPAVVNAMNAYIEGFHENTVGAIGAYDPDTMLYPFKTHADFMDTATKEKAASLAAMVSEEVMTGTHHHIYNLARMDAARREKGTLDTPDDVMEKLGKALEENNGRLSFFDEIEICGNQPYLPDDLQVDLDANRRFEEYHPANDLGGTSEWATQACYYGAALIPLAADNQKVEIATRFIYPVGFAQRIEENPNPKALQALIDVLPEGVGLKEQLGASPKAIAGPDQDTTDQLDNTNE